MSIKKRILLSNVIMILLVIVFMLMFLFFMIKIYTEDYLQPSPEDVYSNQADTYSLSELQVVVEDVSSSLVTFDGDITAAENYVSVRQFLKKTNTTLIITKDNNIVYISDDCTGEDASAIVAGYGLEYITDDPSTLLFSEGETMVCITTVKLKEDSNATMFFTNNSADFRGGNSGFSVFSKFENARIVNSLKMLAITGIGIMVLINLIIVFLIARSILKPLDLLKKGTRMISEGNLDFEINYRGDDEITEVIDNFEDMRRKLSVSMEQQKRYEESRKELIAGISHDLSTPLTSIKGYVSGLMDGVADSPEKQEMYLKTIYNTAEDMDRLVNDLFLFSKLDVDKVPFNFERIDIGEFLSSCCEEMKFAFEKDKLVISFTDRLELPQTVFLDRNQFGRVLINIARNSVKYKKEDVASLHVDLSLLSSEEDAGKGGIRMVRIVLQDNGIGVPPELTGKIFESFYREDTARSNPASGSGLGLAIAKQIVNRHCGVISAESIVGQGLSIIIDLPIAEETPGNEGGNKT